MVLDKNQPESLRQGKTAVVTIVTSNYLAGAVALYNSCRKHYPEASFYCVLVDVTEELCCEISESFQIIDARSLFDGDAWQGLFFQYTAFELCCALKPYSMLHLFDAGYEYVMYLDSDISLLSRPVSVITTVEQHPIILTPHAHHPQQGGLDSYYLRSGAFNAGAIVCSATQNGIAFLKWWRDRTSSDCVDAISTGIFVDQKWLDLVPCIFPKAHILRNPGFNAGHWTIKVCSLERRGRDFYVDGHAIEAFHFSNLMSLNACDRFYEEGSCDKRTLALLKELVGAYEEQCKEISIGLVKDYKYPFDFLPNGTRIKRDWREFYRLTRELNTRFPDPFNVSDTDLLLAELQRIEQSLRKQRVSIRFKSIREKIVRCLKRT